MPAMNAVVRAQNDGELAEATTGKFPVVQTEGGRQVRRDTKHYTLDVAFYVGCLPANDGADRR